MRYTAVRLRAEAEIHLAESSSWYEQQQPGLGNEFLDSVYQTLSTIEQNPLFSPVVYRNTRRALVSRFPFMVFYRAEEQEEEIIIMAVIHGSRHPKRWRNLK